MDEGDGENCATRPNPSIQTGYTAGDSPSLAIVDALAALTDVPLPEVDPLYNSIDPDALDALLGDPIEGDDSGTIRVEFTVSEWYITARNDGQIAIYAANETK